MVEEMSSAFWRGVDGNISCIFQHFDPPYLGDDSSRLQGTGYGEILLQTPGDFIDPYRPASLDQ